MTPQDVADIAASLPGCRRKGTEARPAWYVGDRLVCRLEEPLLLSVKMSALDGEYFVAGFPDVFAAPPSTSRSAEVRVDLRAAGRDPRGDDAVRLAIRAAYLAQRDEGAP